MEVSNNIIKWVYSLSQKKNRDKEKCFVAEGSKCVLDTIGNFKVRHLFATEQWVEAHSDVCHEMLEIVSRRQMDKMSMLKTASDVMAVYEFKVVPAIEMLDKKLSLVLDGIQDPGNLGTIIRIADWFGIENVFCSNDTVDVYNPKVVQATMGAISRVNVRYGSLPQLFQKYPHLPVYATMLDGSNLYDADLQNRGFIVMGNEGKGISEDVAGFANKKLLIPSFPKGAVTSESLNVGMATAVVVAEFRRRII